MTDQAKAVGFGNAFKDGKVDEQARRSKAAMLRISGPAPPPEGLHRIQESMAPGANVPWNHAAAVGQTTVVRHAGVNGFLKVPNTLNFGLFPTLDPYARVVYYQLFLLSHGFHRTTCLVGLPRLAESLLMSIRKVQRTITYLEKRGLVKRLGYELAGRIRGTLYEVILPDAETAMDEEESVAGMVPCG